MNRIFTLILLIGICSAADPSSKTFLVQPIKSNWFAIDTADPASQVVTQTKALLIEYIINSRTENTTSMTIVFNLAAIEVNAYADGPRTTSSIFTERELNSEQNKFISEMAAQLTTLGLNISVDVKTCESIVLSKTE